MSLDSIRKALGLRFYKRVTLMSHPVRVILNLSSRPTLSIGVAHYMLNINSRGIDLRATPAPGMQFRKHVAKWPIGKDFGAKLPRTGGKK